MASALAFAGAGCTLGPDYVRPPVDTPDAYRFAGSAVPDDALAALPDWWKAFDDPELDALIDEGLAANHPPSLITLRPPISALFPGARVSFAVMRSPASRPAVTAPGESFFSAFFSSAEAGASILA